MLDLMVDSETITKIKISRPVISIGSHGIIKGTKLDGGEVLALKRVRDRGQDANVEEVGLF